MDSPLERPHLTQDELREELRVSLKYHLERRLEDLDARWLVRFTEAERAVSKAEVSINARLEGMNEFRAALKDQSSMLATRESVERLATDINEMKQASARMDGRIAAYVAMVSGVTAVVVSALTMLLARWFVP